jgi:hypothetical protein
VAEDPDTIRKPVKGDTCIACGLAYYPDHFSMHWWDIGEIAGWVCHYCHTGRAPDNDILETYRRIRRRLGS